SNLNYFFNGGTCTTDGNVEYWHCSICDKSFSDEGCTSEIESVVIKASHYIKRFAAKPATCTDDGYEAYESCTKCDYSTFKLIKAFGHTEIIDKAVAPSCTTTGLTEGKHCSVCKTVLVKQETVKKLNHTEVIDIAVTPTCTTTGLTEGKHCSRCKEVLVKQETIKALWHTEVVDFALPQTCTTTGLTEGKHCSVCKEVLIKQEVIDAHTPAIDLAISPTCTATGLTEGKHCSVCNEVLVAQTVAAALGHNEAIDAAVAPTCVATGLTEGKHCSRCNIVLVRQTVVEALFNKEAFDTAHVFDDNAVCTVCNFDASYLNAYNGTYGYEYFGTIPNGEGYQKLYRDIDNWVRTVHTCGFDVTTDFVTLDYSTYYLTTEQAVAVWKTYKDDNPLYYWLSSTLSFTNRGLTLSIENKYSLASQRAEYTELVYKKVDEYSARLSSSDGEYLKALAFHDFIIDDIDYAYTSNRQPESAEWAHNIIGVFSG
ncbi:MAG: hypothetical protein K2G31_00910, partial [Clostridia bacterium]|nr:hypothetical protein [Clostridia bacterium]